MAKGQEEQFTSLPHFLITWHISSMTEFILYDKSTDPHHYLIFQIGNCTFSHEHQHCFCKRIFSNNTNIYMVLCSNEQNLHGPLIFWSWQRLWNRCHTHGSSFLDSRYQNQLESEPELCTNPKTLKQKRINNTGENFICSY